MLDYSRRDFLKHSALLSAAALAIPAFAADAAPAIQFGLVTYQWGRDWDINALLRNCTETKVLGVELRTTHAHKVEPNLTPDQRQEVKKRFADSPVKLVSLGSAEDFHNPNPEALKKNIENTKAFIKLGHDVGSTGVKVRPNDLPKNVPVEKTIEQIGKSLNEVGAFAADYGQQIRLEVHGGCAKPSVIKQIMEVATHPNVTVCWNSNNSDQDAPGLEQNFMMLRPRMGLTTHVRQLDTPGYAWQDLVTLFVKTKYQGWLLLEAGGADPADRVKALAQQKALFDQMIAKATA
jgi:hypothetical protein